MWCLFLFLLAGLKVKALIGYKTRFKSTVCVCVWGPKENNESSFQLPQCLEVHLPLLPVAIELGPDQLGRHCQGPWRLRASLCQLNEPHEGGCLCHPSNSRIWDHRRTLIAECYGCAERDFRADTNLKTIHLRRKQNNHRKNSFKIFQLFIRST